MRHLEVKFLWLQEKVQMGKVRVEKVSGATNIAEALKKYLVVGKGSLGQSTGDGAEQM